MLKALTNWYVRWRVNAAIKDIDRQILKVPKGKEEEMKEILQALEEYKRITKQRINQCYDQYQQLEEQYEGEQGENKK